MKIVQINASVKNGSTGKIMYDLNHVINNNGHKGFMISAYNPGDNVQGLYYLERLNSKIAVRKNILISRITGKMGYRYKYKTKRVIKWLDQINPDIIHLHNIHGDWINLEILFNYIKKKNIPIVWTLHDCWAFTGRCSHFEQADCFQWKTGCKKCPNMSVYPISYFFDFSKKMWIDKKNHFCGVRKMTLVTPSQWLADYVKTSFLSEYPVKIINNGINLDIYKPNHRISNFYNEISNKKIILGVATSWSKMKGLEDFIKLDKIIDHEKYIIILVGLNSNQIKLLPDSIISVTKTKNEKELVKYYSSADVFVNLTYQDNYPTTNLEAISCGLPVITYDTGGSPESVTEKTGVIVEQGNLEKIYYAIKDICEGKRNINREDLFEHAKTNFDKNQIFLKYLELYNSLREI